MEIAVFGWGSPVWDPRDLRIRGEWSNDGPHLPVEFVRLSSGGRITLVLSPGAEESPALWARADFEELDDAIENLHAREVTTAERIGFVTVPECTSRCWAIPSILERILK